MKYIAAIMVLAFGSAPAFSDPMTCTSIAADLDRLACYDKETGRTPETVSAAKSGNWDVEIKKSDFEDTTDVYLNILSDEPVACGRFGSPQHASLMIRCMENSTAIFMATSCHLTSGHGGYGNVDVRLDEDKAFVSAMNDSTDNRALGLWSGGKAIPFIKKMLGKERMIMRFTPFSESPTTATFSIAGLDEAITPLREACKW